MQSYFKAQIKENVMASREYIQGYDGDYMYNEEMCNAQLCFGPPGSLTCIITKMEAID